MNNMSRNTNSFYYIYSSWLRDQCLRSRRKRESLIGGGGWRCTVVVSIGRLPVDFISRRSQQQSPTAPIAKAAAGGSGGCRSQLQRLTAARLHYTSSSWGWNPRRPINDIPDSIMGPSCELDS